ncbi:MAG: hypothetical protein J6Y47_04750 [Bacteroidales bacterium]|nr:hypothetical protein [Bacteroidales bacterium]
MMNPKDYKHSGEHTIAHPAALPAFFPSTRFIEKILPLTIDISMVF